MLIEKQQMKLPLIFNLVLLIVCGTISKSSVNGLNPRKLDETTVPTTPNGDQKCTACASVSPPPPPPSLPSPPPEIPPPSSRPPSHKKPPSSYCPPPPPGSYLYITGPPGNLYPVVDNFNGASRHTRSLATALPALVVFLSLLVFW